MTSRTIGVLIEEHFDETEYRRFNEYFPEHGYEVRYISRLWGNESLTFKGNDHTETVTVTTDIDAVDPEELAGLVLVGGYAMDRLRYEEHPSPDGRNAAPAVEFLRRAVKLMDDGRLPIGTICHSLWLFCADNELLQGREVTCAHNIISDVRNAGGVVVYDGEEAAVTHVHGGLVSGRHPGVVDEFLARFLPEVERRTTS